MASDAVTACDTCGLVQRTCELAPGQSCECARCGVLLRRRPRGVAATAAFSLAALALYVPANIYPILRVYQHGAYSESTIWDGVRTLMQAEQWFVAAVVFAASIVIPLFKLFALLFLVVTVQVRRGRRLRSRTRLYRIVDGMGPWAMLDVFLVAILVALVKLGDLVTVMPGAGLIAFTGVVVFTILASQAFDPKVMWEGR